MYPLLIILAIVPALIISYFIYRIDRYDKESHWQLVICFVLGMLITYPTMEIEAIGEANGLEASTNIIQLLAHCFLLVGFTEEIAKFIVLMLYAYPRREFNEPLDGIVYAVMISMGFAAIENIIYANRFGLETTILRAFTAVPAHAAFGVFMGYYVGLAKFNKPKRSTFILLGLVLASVIHGLYDLFILQHYYDWLILFAILVLCVSLYFAFNLIRLHQINSPFNSEEMNMVYNKQQEIEEAEIIEDHNEITDAIIKEMKKE